MIARPDYSPTMLRFFLRARVAHHGKAVAARLRKAARVTVAQFDMAWMGRLQSPEPRLKLWGALGIQPADHGIALTHGGQFFEARLPGRAACLARPSDPRDEVAP